MASKRRLRRNGCGHKAKHKTLEAARIAAAISARIFQTRMWLRAYKCEWCSYYHIGRVHKKD